VMVLGQPAQARCQGYGGHGGGSTRSSCSRARAGTSSCGRRKGIASREPSRRSGAGPEIPWEHAGGPLEASRQWAGTLRVSGIAGKGTSRATTTAGEGSRRLGNRKGSGSLGRCQARCELLGVHVWQLPADEDGSGGGIGRRSLASSALLATRPECPAPDEWAESEAEAVMEAEPGRGCCSGCCGIASSPCRQFQSLGGAAPGVCHAGHPRFSLTRWGSAVSSAPPRSSRVRSSWEEAAFLQQPRLTVSATSAAPRVTRSPPQDEEAALRLAEHSRSRLAGRAFRHWWVLNSHRHRARQLLQGIDGSVRRVLQFRAFRQWHEQAAELEVEGRTGSHIGASGSVDSACGNGGGLVCRSLERAAFHSGRSNAACAAPRALEDGPRLRHRGRVYSRVQTSTSEGVLKATPAKAGMVCKYYRRLMCGVLAAWSASLRHRQCRTRSTVGDQGNECTSSIGPAATLREGHHVTPQQCAYRQPCADVVVGWETGPRPDAPPDLKTPSPMRLPPECPALPSCEGLPRKTGLAAYVAAAAVLADAAAAAAEGKAALGPEAGGTAAAARVLAGAAAKLVKAWVEDHEEEEDQGEQPSSSSSPRAIRTGGDYWLSPTAAFRPTVGQSLPPREGEWLHVEDACSEDGHDGFARRNPALRRWSTPRLRSRPSMPCEFEPVPPGDRIPRTHRSVSSESVAAQTIGVVGAARQHVQLSLPPAPESMLLHARGGIGGAMCIQATHATQASVSAAARRALEHGAPVPGVWAEALGEASTPRPRWRRAWK